MVGPEGRGVKTIIEKVNYTRLDCVIGSAGLMRKALVEAGHHAAHRHAFEAKLIEQPLMRNVLADLALESEAATTDPAAGRGCRPGDQRGRGRAGVPAHRHRGRQVLGDQAGPAFTAEALECLGGNGYVEESSMPRLYREAPLNSVWEGSGNVNALDVLRALAREPGTAEALLTELSAARGANAHLDAAVSRLGSDLGAVAGDLETAQLHARRLVELMALALQGSLLVRHAPRGGGRRLLRHPAGRRLGPRIRHRAESGGRQRGPRPGAAGVGAMTVRVDKRGSATVVTLVELAALQ